MKNAIKYTLILIINVIGGLAIAINNDAGFNFKYVTLIIVSQLTLYPACSWWKDFFDKRIN